MMTHHPKHLILILLLPALGSCDAFVGFFQPTTTTVRLVNNADFDVQTTLYYSSEQLVPEDVLITAGTELSYTLSPGETASFSRDCDDLQAVIVDDADLQVIGGGGPEARSDVQRDGTNYNCGDIITFTFDHSAVVIDFDVAVSVTQE